MKHEEEMERLSLTTQRFKTVKLFILAIDRYLSQLRSYLWSFGGGWLIPLSIIVMICSILLVNVGPHEKHVKEVVQYIIEFGLWWVALGVASTIGLGAGSGLHTFVLYLGPHIALFTLKATQCGRVDITSSPTSEGIPLSKILPQIHLEAILWELGLHLVSFPLHFKSCSLFSFYH